MGTIHDLICFQLLDAPNEYPTDSAGTVRPNWIGWDSFKAGEQELDKFDAFFIHFIKKCPSQESKPETTDLKFQPWLCRQYFSINMAIIVEFLPKNGKIFQLVQTFFCGGYTF